MSPVDVVARLREAAESGLPHPLDWREEQLRGLLRLLRERADDIAAALQADLRRDRVTANMLDVVPTAGEARHALRHLRRWAAPQRVRVPLTAMPARARVQWEPLGVVLVVAPWNYPLHLALGPAVAALAAGNAVVIKPSELTPRSSALLAELVPRYLDPAGVAVVEGGPEVTQELIASPVDHVFFTGSTAVGREVAKAAAEHLVPVTLELGGRSPVVVTAAARLDVAARRVAWGKVLNAGQTCVAPDHVLVEEAVREEFVDLVTASLRRFTEGRSLPVLHERHARRLAGLLEGAGGVTALGGGVEVGDARVEATVVVDPDPSSALVAEEVFGPVLPVVTVDGLDDAVARIRRGGRPLASYLFSEDAAEQERFTAQVVTGGVAVNHVMVHLSVPELPFGGVGTSGTGRYHGRWGFERLSNPKGVLHQSTRVDLPLVYPPYRGWKRRLLGG